MIAKYSIQTHPAWYAVCRRIGVHTTWLSVDSPDGPLWMFDPADATAFMNIANATQALIDNVDLDLVTEFEVSTDE